MKPPRILVRVFVLLVGAGALSGAASAPFRQSNQEPSEDVSALTPQQQEFDRLLKEGNRASQRGDFSAALKAFETGLAQAQSLQDDKATARFLTNLGNVYNRSGQFDRALDFYQRALLLREKLGNDRVTARALTNVGVAYNSLGRYDLALDFFQRALKTFEQFGSEQSIAASLYNIGYANEGLGRYDRALDFFQRALKIEERLGNEKDIATSHYNIGNIYSHLGQFDRALTFYQEALKTFEKLGHARGIAAILSTVGKIHTSLGEYDTALDFLQRAQKTFEALGDAQDIAMNLNDLGNVYKGLGRYDLALDFLQQALKRNEKSGNAQHAAMILSNIGSVYERQRRYDPALDCYQQALKTFETLDNDQNMAMALTNLGSLYEKRGQLDRARECYEQAVAHLEALSRQVIDPATLGALQDTLPTLYARYARLLHRKPGSGDTEALAVLEQGRARGLALLAVQARTDVAALLSAEDAARWKAANDELATAASLLTAAETRLREVTEDANSSAGQKQAAQKQRNDALIRHETAQRQLASLRAVLMTRYPRFKQLYAPPRPTVRQFAALAQQRPDTLFVEWGVVDDETLLLFTLDHRQGVRGYEVSLDTRALESAIAAYDKVANASGNRTALRPGESLLARAVAVWRAAIEQGRYLSGDQAPIGKEGERLRSVARAEERLADVLFQTLFRPLLTQKRMDWGRAPRLVVVGDGPLLDLPFAALREAQDHRLVERCALSTAVSLHLLLRPASEKQPTGTLLCAADPTGRQPRQFVSRQVGATAIERAGLGPLDHAREEAQSVVRLVPRSVGWAGPQASEAAVKDAMARYQVLHFATHGVLNGSNGLSSWLALAEAARPTGSKEDGRLEAREVVPMQLAAEMAVLSACESGLGQRSGGEGLLGLAWGFQAAGCSSVVASLWRVNDTATRDLMVAFYTGLKRGKRKDDALREAMLRVRGNDRDAAHSPPFFWAGFQVIGESGPLSLLR